MLGCSDGVPLELLKECLEHLAPWVKLCIHVVKSENPDIDVLQCFSVLHLQHGGRRGSDARQKKKDIEQLAHAFGQNADELQALPPPLSS